MQVGIMALGKIQRLPRFAADGCTVEAAEASCTRSRGGGGSIFSACAVCGVGGQLGRAGQGKEAA